MGEIRRIGDRITVLRDGRKVATVDAKSSRDDRLIEMMTGRKITAGLPDDPLLAGRGLLKVENLTLASRTVRNVSITVRAGEVVGMAGLVGSGKSDVGRAAFGLGKVAAGRILYLGRDISGASVRSRLKAGIFYVPSDRRAEGLVLSRGVRENIALPSLDRPEFAGPILLRRSEERRLTRGLAERVDLRPLQMERDIEHFSGGNQQKVMIAKALSREVKLFIFDEPTVGVDVGTRVAIYSFIRTCARRAPAFS